MERIAGGNESDVYRTDDARFVVKLKNEPYPTVAEALLDAQKLRAAAAEFAEIIGSEHSIPSHFLIAGNGTCQAYIIITQSYLKDSQPLFFIDYAALSPELRRQVADQLQTIIRRSIRSYWRRGVIPDIYGRSAASPEERVRRNSLPQLPARMWSFLVRRTLLRAHNLLLTPEQQIRLIDYDPVRQPELYKRIYYAVRATLFLRDIFFIWLMKHTGWAY
ncbi:MAG: hypothetical protein AAF614_15585 [Chloroflexota bacterium]